MTKSRGIILNRQRWTKLQLAVLRREYPHRPSADVARRVGHSLASTYQYAQRLGLRKSAAYLVSEASGRLRDGNAGIAHRFAKGHETWNKGAHWTAGGRSVTTRFQKGRRPHTWRPVGTERVSKDGIRQRKVTDTGYPPADWRAVHTIMWEQANGPVPAGHIVVFRDRNREHLELANFELVTRQELMRRNTVHNYPKEIVQVIQLKGAIQRQINKREPP